MNSKATPATLEAAAQASSATEALLLAEALTMLTADALQPSKVEHAHFVNVPPGYTQADITKLVEAAAPRPSRKRGIVELAAVESLIQYCKDQGAATTAYVFINEAQELQREGRKEGKKDRQILAVVCFNRRKWNTYVHKVKLEHPIR